MTRKPSHVTRGPPGLTLVLGMALVTMSACASLPTPSSRAPIDTWLAHRDGVVLVVSHRSCWKMTSENSLDGIDACVRAGIDMVEIDVRTTSDGILVLMHDETVDRTTNGHGAVADLTFAQIRALRLKRMGGGQDAPLTDRVVPTLAEALSAAKGRVLVNLDVKAADQLAVMETVERSGDIDQALLNTLAGAGRPSAADVATRLSRLQPVLFERTKAGSVRSVIDAYDSLRPAGYQLIFDTQPYLDEALAAIRPTGARIFVNTMANDIASGRPMNLAGPYRDTDAVENPEAVWGALTAQGVDIIQTDTPLELLAYLRGRGLHP